ncbi:MAG: hypothetical protein JKY37_29020 [Nannocystaceae bacterium]|nr:hypothetical protein [Nannocystaceae bacterium]
MRLRAFNSILGLAAVAVLTPGCPSDGGADQDDGVGSSSGSSATGGDDGDDGVDGTDEGQDDGPGESAGSEAADESGAPLDCNEDELTALYTRYVQPFVSGVVPQSCGECHMTGIDMSLYAQDTPCDTMACMVGQGVVDLDNPAASSLLSMIDMGDPNSSVFNVSVEHAAMLEWIDWSAQCHQEVCGDIASPCEQNTGAGSTGTNPIGDCSEDDLLVTFWNTVTVDRGRCLACHSDWGQTEGTFGACNNVSDCEGPQLCVDGFCRAPGPISAPHFFEGAEESLDWDNPVHRELGRATMYNIVALGLIDTENPEDSSLITKPLLEDFTPTAVFGPNVAMPSMPPDSGMGIAHGGTSKFNFGCHEEPCPTEGVIDCRESRPCGDDPCPDGSSCSDGFCRVTGSVCDKTLEAYYGFVNYFAECKGG